MSKRKSVTPKPGYLTLVGRGHCPHMISAVNYVVEHKLPFQDGYPSNEKIEELKAQHGSTTTPLVFIGMHFLRGGNEALQGIDINDLRYHLRQP